MQKAQGAGTAHDGSDLAQVDRYSRALYDAAPASQPAISKARKLVPRGSVAIAGRFDMIDTARRGWVSFDDVKRYMREQGATLLPD